MTPTASARRIFIRNARSADIPAIRAMQERSMWVLGGDFYAAGDIAAFLIEFGTMDDAIVEEGHFLVAEDHRGAILGSGGWTRKRPGYADALGESGPNEAALAVRGVFVDPAAARRGIASSIMARVEWDAIEHGLEALHLTATLSGVPLYERLGYARKETLQLALKNGSRFACITMTKRLPRSRELAA